MPFLVGKLLFCLLVAALLGVWLGWMISRVFARKGIDHCQSRLDVALAERETLAEEIRSLKLEYEVCEQKRETLETRCYEQQQAIDHERYLSNRYKEMLDRERKKAINERFALERDLTQKEIHIGELDTALQKTRLKAAREVNLLNARLRSRGGVGTVDEPTQADEEEQQALRAALAERERQLEAIREQLREIEARDDESTQELRQSARMYQELQELYGALKEEHQAFRERYRELEENYEAIAREKNALETQIIDIKEKETAVDASVESIRDRQETLVRDLTKAEERLHRCEAERKRTIEKLKAQQTHCRSITEHFADLDKALAEARAENARLVEELARKSG